jgi:cell division protein FtsZ
LEGVNIKGAKSVLLNVTGSSNLTMQEINEGNNVIFEAAGEEANVIFGCVRKEEMNDYVSYTVIATGFEGSHTAFAEKGKAVNVKPKEKEIFRGGFNFLDTKDVDTEDLEVPTIIRVQSPKSSIDKDEEPKSGFNIEGSRYNWARDKENKKEEVKSEEEDSSSFLRMIMD